MGKVLHVLIMAVLTWNCVTNSYTIRNMYRRMPVDRSSQGLAQIMLEKNSKVPTKSKPAKSEISRQASEPAGIPLPTLSTAAKNAVLGVRNDLSNLGGTIIGGFQELTGLKLKKNPGYDDVLPFIPSLSPGHPSVKKSGSQKAKLIQSILKETKEREKQYKRQTGQPDFTSPPYAAQKDQKKLPTIWYTEPKEPLHVKIGNDLKGVIDYFAPGAGNLFIDENEVDTGALRGERDSAYGAPVAPVYGAPAEPSYAAPSEPSYGAPPEPSYGAPAEPSYGAPVEPSYGAPVEDSYGEPEIAIAYDVPSYEAEDVLNTMVYGSEEKLPLLLKVITDYNKVFNFYAGQSAQIAAFYAPGLIPILRKFGFDVKRIRWVPEILEKFKPTDAEEDSYGSPVAAYGEPAITYEEPETAYGAPATGYEQPEPSYGAPAPSYHEPAPSPSYNEPAPSPSYHEPAPSYNEPAPTYNEPAPSYHVPSPSYQPAATEPVPVYHAPDNSYAPPSHYAPPQHNHVHASSKRDKKDVKKVQKSSLDVVPDHHDELLTAVPALELLKLKKKLNRKEAREKNRQSRRTIFEYSRRIRRIGRN